jgi:hypothetical protein
MPPFLQVSLGDDTPQVAQEQLKAVYLYNFLQFVTWPNDQTPAGEATPKVIGIIGDSTLSKTLEEVGASLEKRNKSTILIKNYGHYEEGVDLSTCHILFVSASEKQNFGKIITSLKHAPVLTVSDSKDFLSVGGMISLQEEQHRLRYTINRKESTRAELRLSSQLLKTAITITDE